MTYCINPRCIPRLRPETEEVCGQCGLPLNLDGRYRLEQLIRAAEHRLADLQAPISVFKAVDQVTGQPQVIKVLEILRPQDWDYGLRFWAGSEALKTLNEQGCAGVPQVSPGDDESGTLSLSLGEDQELSVSVVEWIEGPTLEAWVQERGTLSPGQAVDLLQQLLQILVGVHQAGILHRDIKPANVVHQVNLGQHANLARQANLGQHANLGQKLQGNWVLIDFGAAGNEKLLRGERIFSLGYSAPEMQRGLGEVRSDLYSVGATVLYGLTGRHLDAWAQENTPWQSVLARQVPVRLVRFLESLVAPELNQRPPSALAALEQLAEDQKTQVQRLLEHSLASGMVRSLGLSVLGVALVSVAVPVWSFSTAQRLFREGQVALEGGNAIVAEQLFRQALSLNPSEPAIQDSLVDSLQHQSQQALLQENPERAEVLLRQGLELDPQNPQLYNNLGMACRLQENLPCAATYFQQAIELDPDYFIARYNLAINLDAMGYISAAQEQYTSALTMALESEVDPQFIVSLQNNLARISNLEAEPEKAQELALAGIQLAQTQVEADGDYPKRLAALYKNLGWAVLQMGDYDQAKTALEESIRLDPWRSDAYCHLAATLEELEDPAEVTLWQACLDHSTEADSLEVKLLQERGRRHLRR